MNYIIDILSSSCPLILCSMGALFSEYAGILALFIDGTVSFSAFLTYAFTLLTGNPILGTIISSISTVIIIFSLTILIEKFRANKFIAAMAINLLLSALPSCFSSVFYKTRGVLTDPAFMFNLPTVKWVTISLTVLLVVTSILFLLKTRPGLYIRITGSDSDVLKTNGINPMHTRILSWCIAAFFSSIAGSLLTFRINSFVPNISSGRGWMALCAVFMGKKKPFKIIIAVLIFCFASFFATNIQNILPQLPSSVYISFPYLLIFVFVLCNRSVI